MTLLGTVLGPVLGTVTVNVPQLMFNCKQTEREREREQQLLRFLLQL